MGVQQDNDKNPKHTVRCTKEWFDDNNIIAESPNLNLIKNFYKLIERIIRVKCSTNCDDFFVLTQAAKYEIPESV